MLSDFELWRTRKDAVTTDEGGSRGGDAEIKSRYIRRVLIIGHLFPSLFAFFTAAKSFGALCRSRAFISVKIMQSSVISNVPQEPQ